MAEQPVDPTAPLYKPSSNNDLIQNSNGSALPVSALSTPGPDFPGAYPHGTPDDIGAERPFDTMKKYMPSQDTVKNAVLNVGENAKQYLPNSITSYFPSATTQSHQEGIDTATPSQQESTKLTSESGVTDHEKTGQAGGIGSTSIPSNPPNTNTSLLTPSSTHESDSTTSSNLSTQAQRGSETARSISDITTRSSSFGSSATPRMDNRSTDDSPSVDTLLAHSSREDKEKTSDVSETKQYEDNRMAPGSDLVHTQARTHPLAGPGARWKGVPLEEAYQQALDEHPDRQLNLGADQHDISTNDAPYKYTTSGEMKNDLQHLKSKFKGNSTTDNTQSPRSDFSNAKFDSNTADAGHSPVVDVGHPSGAAETTSPRQDTEKESAERNGGGNSPRRSNFLHKIKGEVKIISGKLAHNEDKVAEGKRLLGKDV